MTSLLTVVSVIGLILICLLMAKYNKSDSLFWILLVSLFAGMAGGAIFNKLNNENDEEKQTNFEQVYNPTQVPQWLGIGFCTEPSGPIVLETEPVGKETETPAFGIKVNLIAPSKVSGEIRGQPTYFNPRNKGTPGFPFDTS